MRRLEPKWQRTIYIYIYIRSFVVLILRSSFAKLFFDSLLHRSFAQHMLIHNASRPRRSHLRIRVLVCPWKAFLNRVNTILDRLAFGLKLISIGPNYHQNGTRIQSKYHANHTSVHPWAGFDRQVAKRRHVGSKWGALGPEKIHF